MKEQCARRPGQRYRGIVVIRNLACSQGAGISAFDHLMRSAVLTWFGVLPRDDQYLRTGENILSDESKRCVERKQYQQR